MKEDLTKRAALLIGRLRLHAVPCDPEKWTAHLSYIDQLEAAIKAEDPKEMKRTIKSIETLFEKEHP